MKIKKSEQTVFPKYPSYRQFSESRTLVGLATLGLTAMTGLSDPVGKGVSEVRLGGDIAVEPSRSQPVRLGGKPAVEPSPVALPGAPPICPTVTNHQGSVSYRVKKGDTLSSLAKEYLGNSGRWQEIAALNPGLTAETLKADSIIQMPAKALKIN